MFRLERLKIRFILIGLLVLTIAAAFYFHAKANSVYQTIIPKETTFYTPGQKDNCKWVIHVSQKITTERIKLPNTNWDPRSNKRWVYCWNSTKRSWRLTLICFETPNTI